MIVIPDVRFRTLYIVGRTPNLPYTYYWRQFKNLKCSGWEKITDINDDHVMPFVMDNNLHIAWPTITKKTAKQISTDSSTDTNPKASDDPADNTTDLHADCWEIKLNWIRRDSKGWTKKKVSSDADALPRPHGKPIFCNTGVNDSRKEITFRMEAQTDNTEQETVTFSVYNNRPTYNTPDGSIEYDNFDDENLKKNGVSIDFVEVDKLTADITTDGTYHSFCNGYDGIGKIYSLNPDTYNLIDNKTRFDNSVKLYENPNNDQNFPADQHISREVKFTVSAFVESFELNGTPKWFGPDPNVKDVTFTFKYVIREFKNNFSVDVEKSYGYLV